MAVNIVSRERVEALIREQIVDTIFQDTPKQSAFMSMARKLPNMTSNQTRIRVLDYLPIANWVNGDTGMIETSEQAWDNVYIDAAELAVIVPIPENVLNDAERDLIGEITPRIMEAIGQKVDSAIVFGVNRPANWQMDIISLARQAGNNVAATAGKDYYDLLLGEKGVFARVENGGYAVTGAMADTSFRSKLRGLRDTTGQPIFVHSMQDSSKYSLDGVPLTFPLNGSFRKNITQIVVGDFSQAVYAIRQDVDVKILDQGVIQDPVTKEIVYNLAQQDMIAIRVTFRMGWAIPNPATRLDEDRTACAFAYLEPTTPETVQDVTFTFSDDDGNAKDVAVNIDNARCKSGADGKAVFHLRKGTYTAKITKKGYVTMTETVVVDETAVNKEITLVKNL